MGVLDYITDEDIPYETALLKDPHSLEKWLNYITFKQKTASVEAQLAVLNRAVNSLTRSYKIWMIYLRTRRSIVEKNPSECEILILVQLYKKSLASLNKFPTVWTEYLSYLVKNLKYTGTHFVRDQFNEALQCLTVSQHGQIWALYLQFADLIGDDLCFAVYRRFFIFKIGLDQVGYTDSEAEKLADLELVLDKLIELTSNEAQLAKMSEVFEYLSANPGFLVKLSRSELELHVQYFDLLTSLPGKCQLSNPKTYGHRIVDLFGHLTRKFPDQLGQFTVKLALYWANIGEYLRSIDVFETGIQNAVTLKDFTVIYDAYVDMEESRLGSLANEVEQIEAENGDSAGKNIELNILFSRFENLLNRRKFMSNEVLLRQNKNNVAEWLNRIELFDPEKEMDKIIDCYAEAIEAINPQKVSESGLLPKLWINYATLYEKNHDLSSARSIFNTATKVPFNDVEDLVIIWISWTEMELNNNEFDQAILVIKKAVEIPTFNGKINYLDTDLSPQLRVHRSNKLWGLYLDLVESSGDVEETCKVYDEVLDLKLATPLIVLNYASFLQENEKFEESFRVYERGVDVFKYPTVYEIWNAYLTTVVRLQSDLNLNQERIRDLFEQSLVDCPFKLAKSIYLLYANFEEVSGSKLRSLRVLKQAIDKAETSTDKLELYQILITKTMEFKDLESTRPIYEEALQEVSIKTPGFTESLVVAFVQTEAKLNELKRCREIFKYVCELFMRFSKKDEDIEELWGHWKQFELDHGSEQTYKDMLRYRRHLENVLRPIIEQRAAKKAAVPVGFVASSEGPKVTSLTFEQAPENAETDIINKDQIELDLSDIE